MNTFAHKTNPCALKTKIYELSLDVVGGAYAAERARRFYW